MSDLRAANREITPEERADMVARYGRGQSQRDIGFALGRSATTVAAVLKEEGIQGRRRNGTWLRVYRSGGRKFTKRPTVRIPFGKCGS